MAPTLAKKQVVAENLVDQSAYRECVQKVCNTIWNVLRNHCGPTARHAAWPHYDADSSMSHTEFSKDGISIVKSLSYPDDSLEACIVGAVAYVGSRVDNACHDGTTTAMMTMVRVVSKLISNRLLDTANPHHVTGAIKMALGVMEKALDDSKMTADVYAKQMGISVADARKKIAYSQAMISSKGDHELSEALSELVASVPVEEFFGLYNLDHRIHETDTRVELKSYDANIAIEAVFAHPGLYNHKLKTEYKQDDIDLLVTENGIMDHSPLHKFLSEHITSALRVLQDKNVDGEGNPLADPHPFVMRERDLMIITPEMSPRLQLMIHDYNNLKEQNKLSGKLVAVTLTNSGHPSQVLFLKGIRALAQKTVPEMNIYDLESCVIKNANVHHYGGKTFIGGLYEKDDSTIYVPAYLDMDNAFEDYRILVEDLTRSIKDHLAAHNDSRTASINFKDHLVLYRNMIAQNWMNIKLGGSTHDLRSLISVTEDTFGAVISAMEHGFVFGGIWRMMAALHQARRQEGITSYERVVYTDFITSLNEVLMISYGLDNKHDPKGNEHDLHLLSLRMDDLFQGQNPGDPITDALNNPLDHMVYVQQTEHDEIWRLKTAEDIADSHTVLFQPVKGYYELLRRLKELLPGFATTATYFTRAR